MAKWNQTGTVQMSDTEVILTLCIQIIMVTKQKARVLARFQRYPTEHD